MPIWDLIGALGYDYSGYGQSSGKPSEQNTYADVEAVYKCLEESYGAKQENIILYGQTGVDGSDGGSGTRPPGFLLEEHFSKPMKEFVSLCLKKVPAEASK
ncbi:Alpha/beta hydrolase domain-containing protein 17C [Camellia lanceoleosa]|uniref:Alpha/beta hydrolase domain-containing protein 17C n=1 Tax=Camellia lanceoleosa TaxID=1840588 RepID=A0ACC0G4G9_9ERIC|nr:Alpha/beta hydrolase domain-containing protein 17C [Camellia lanceoleosa]